MDRKKRIELFAFYDHNGISAHLEKMAAKGWMVEEMGPYFWTYKRIEPSKLRFAVTYYPDASGFRPGPSEEELLLAAYCQAAGWQLVTRWLQMQIYCNAAAEPVPLETDAVIQVDTINEAAWRSHLRQYWGILLVMFFLALFYVLMAAEGISSMEIWLPLLGITAWCIVELAAYYIWYEKAERMAREEGVLLPTKSRRGFQLVILAGCSVCVLRELLMYPNSSYAAAAIPLIAMVATCALCERLLSLCRVPARWASLIAVLVGCAAMLLVRPLLLQM